MRTRTDVRHNEYPSVIQSFVERASRDPDRVAIEASGHALTNRQLSQWSAAIAGLLAEHGVVPDARVAIIGPRGPAAVASMIATLAIGAVVVPLDSSTPLERRRRMIVESGASVVIQIGDGAPLVSEGIPLLRLPAWPQHEPAAANLEFVDRSSSDPAYIFFTSGSTGKPKGILGSWGGFTHFMHWMAETFAIDESDRVALTRSLGFDAVMREIFVPLLSGARIVVAPDPLDPDEAIAWLRNQRITVINATPSHAEMWLESVEASTSSLRWVFFSGEILTTRLISEWRLRVSPTGELVNFYGPTETTFIRTFQIVGEIATDEPIPIGSPLPGTEILILDAEGQPASRGEIVIRTAFGTLGYINVDDDKSFVANPLTGDPDDIVYRTGDTGEIRGDGALLVTGRTDLQMKILGVRIEPGEIETKLEQHPTIKRAAIVPIEHGGRIVRVDAAIVPHGDPPTTASLRQHLAQTIPRVAIPARFVMVDALPVNANGKIDRAQISRLVAESSNVTFDPPTNPREDRLAALSPAKRALLERRLQGATATQKPESTDPEPTDTANRIAQLSPAKRALLEARHRKSGLDRQSVKRAPLSSAQERLWVLDRMYPGSANYSITKAYILRGTLDVDTLRVACERLATRHEILRTRYFATDGDPFQEVDPPGPVQFALVDLSNWSGDKQAEADRIRIEESSYPFDLAHDSIWRTTVVRLAPDEHLLVTVLHHIASDGWSMPILFSELSSIYNALRSGAEPDLEPLPIQYVDYSIRQRNDLDVGAYDDDLAYWRQRLAGAPDILDLKADRTRPAIMTFGGRNVRFVLKHTAKIDFLALARQESVTGFMLSVAVFIAHLHERSGSDDVVVGIPSADRGSGDTQGLIGFLVNTLAIRHQLAPGGSFRDVLRAVRGAVLESFDHREVPFEQVVRTVAPVRHADRTPLFQVLFQYGVSAFTAAPDFFGIAAEQVEREAEASKFDFTMYLEAEEDALAGNLVYNTDLFDASTIEQMIDDFDRLAHRLVSNPDSVILAKSDLAPAPSEVSSAPPSSSDQLNAVDPEWLARMCDIWGEVIGTEVGPDDNFFELGGHSLTAIRAFSRIDAEWDIGLPISAIFESPTPRSFVWEIEKLRRGTQTEASIPPASPPIERSPLSFAQRRLWFLHMLTPDAGDYHTPWRVRLKGDLSLEAVQHAIDTIIVRHPVFRTRIQEDSGVPFQVVDEPLQNPLKIVDVGTSPAELSAALRKEASAPFDLANEHPIRTTVFRIAPDDHILSIVAHHIATDADSMSIVRHDLEALYAAHLSGKPANLPDVLSSYAQFATQQARELTPDDPDLDWWLKSLEGSTSNLDLPADRIRPPHSGGEAGVVRCEVDRDVSDAIQRLAQDEGMTPFMTYLAGYALLIHRSTRQDDFVVGIPSTERNSVELENVVGFFVNPLPIRIRVEPGITIRRFLNQIRSTVLEALAHRHVPFEAVVEHLDAPRDPSRTPIFQTMFDLRSVQAAQLTLPYLSTIPLGIPFGPHPAKFDLRTHVTARTDNVTFLIEFRNDLYDLSTVDAMAEHFSGLLRAVADDPDVRVDMLRLEPTGPASEPRSIPSAGLIELVDDVIGRAGSATAVVDGKTSYSYTEIDAASHEVATRLSMAGVGPGDTVGIQMPRGAGFVAAVVGILRAGAVYVPLDLGYPQARIDTIAEDAGLKAILSQGNSIDHPLIEVRAVPGKPYPVSDRMAYIMYTSGSTGSPKGVEIEERSIINLVCEPDYVEITRETVIGFASNTGFDAATFEVWGALLNGATLHVLDNATLLAPETLTDEIRTSGITVMFMTSALFNAVILHSPAAFSSLETLMIGGEALDPDTVRLCLATGPPRRLVNAYGPTETTTFATWKPIVTVPTGAKTIPIGTAIAGASVSVVDANLNPLPTGAPGELVIGGHGIAAGYRGNPLATAERFVTLDGKRMYRTGDLVRCASNGDIEFLGRIDRQVKLRGFRIEPGEIEAHLRSHPAIEQAHVVVRSTEHDSRLVAYVVGQVTPQTAIDHLYPLLPGFMIPSAAVVLDALPITPNGKIDEAALPAPGIVQQTSGNLHGDAQIAMARLWEEALEVEGIGADSNFFDLGGHSLLAIRLMAAIEQQYGERLPLSALFEAPTLAALTDRIGGMGAEATGPVVTIKSQGSGSPIVCMPPAGGNVMTYELMSRSLNAGRPIVGIEAVGLDGTSSPLNTVEALADHCRTSMTAKGITGPYILVGYSLGGLIAFEVARRLRNEGEEVELVVVIDARVRPKKSHVPGSGKQRPLGREHKTRNIPPLTKRLALRVRRIGGRLRHGPKTVIARVTGRPLSPRLVERLMFRAAAKAASTYEAGPYDGRMLFVLAGDTADPAKAGVIAGWRELVGPNLEVVGVPGTHRGEESLMRAPHADRVAAQIQAALTGEPTETWEVTR